MTDETQSDARAEAEGPLAGQRLAAARKEREISIFDIAKELHLDEHKVQALEENRFETLGAPVFAKGHLRKYAELVGVPVEDVLADYYTMNRAVGAPPVVGRVRQPERDIRLGPWIVSALTALVIAAAAYWWFNRDPAQPLLSVISEPETRLALPPQDTPVADDAESAAVEGGVADSMETTAVTAELAAGTEPDDPIATVVDAAPDVSGTVPAGSDTAGAGGVSLTMNFSGDCWTEVTDAAGARLFFDLGNAGRSVQVSGEPPLRVLFGNSDNVTVEVDGQDYPILAAMRRGKTATLTINKQ